MDTKRESAYKAFDRERLDNFIDQVGHTVDAGACLIGDFAPSRNRKIHTRNEPFSLVFLAGITALGNEEMTEDEVEEREGVQEVGKRGEGDPPLSRAPSAGTSASSSSSSSSSSSVVSPVKARRRLTASALRHCLNQRGVVLRGTQRVVIDAGA